jgi:CubicO group peptidase (beta-lactamase class C family)
LWNPEARLYRPCGSSGRSQREQGVAMLMSKKALHVGTVALASTLALFLGSGDSALPLSGREVISLLAAPARAQEPEQNPRQRRGQAVEGLIESSGEEALLRFIDPHVAPEYRDSFAPGALLDHLRRIRAACAGAGGVLWEPAGDDGLRIRFLQDERETTLLLRLQSGPPHLITALDLEGSREARTTTPVIAPFTWETLAQRLDEEARAGFSGTVLVARDGRIVLHRGYGLADRERKTPVTTETIFAIGSVPIDFTKAAILKLVDLGKLRLADPITKFLSEVPADKRVITLDQLMTGRSGLPDFHHIAGVDADYDLSWIDRETAIRRILSQDLLFPPGAGEAHSHSAWVLLAAIVEMVSGQAYGGFLRQHFFEPAGMTRTGLHEDAARLRDEAFAIGYEGRPAGKLNIPKYWGSTSWLVMGSGGMQSCPLDLYKWLMAIRSGGLLSPESAARYWTGGVLAGGDDRGFFCLYTEGPGNLMILCSNAHAGGGDLPSRVGRGLVELVREEAPPRYSLGIQMEPDPERGTAVRAVTPGSAAERDGLQVGDRLLAANGRELSGRPLEILAPFLQSGEPITFEIERGGTRMEVTVRPDPRPGVAE